MRRTLVLSLGVLIAGVVVAAAGENTKLTGYIIDNACAAKHAGDANMGDFVKGHPKGCNQMPGCIASGHQLYVDGKLYKFDKESESKVTDVVKKEKSDKGLKVNVEGTVDGDTIHVTSISETS